jgi:hypothetical protein
MSKCFAVYLIDSGQILQSATGTDASVQGFRTATTEILEISEASVIATGYVEDGAIHPFHAQPSPHHVFDYTTKQWIDPRTLADLKLVKNAEINAARLKANRGTFTFMGKPISCDELSRSDIDGLNGIVTLLGAMPPDWIGFWKTADNDYIAIPDVATWTGLYGAMVAQGQANFAHSQALKAALAAAATAAEVEAIAW